VTSWSSWAEEKEVTTRTRTTASGGAFTTAVPPTVAHPGTVFGQHADLATIGLLGLVVLLLLVVLSFGLWCFCVSEN
jgi:hypothetical protein